MADDKSSLTDRLLAYAEKATKSVSDAWDKTMGMPEEIAKQTYDYVISKGGSEEDAQRIADRLAAKAGRTTGLIDLLVPQSPADVALMAAGPLGPATKMGKAALGTGAALTVMDPTEAEASPLTKIQNVFYRGIPRLRKQLDDQVSGLHVKERNEGDVFIAPNNTKDYAWASNNPDVANTYTQFGGTVIPLKTVKDPDVVLDAEGQYWNDFFYKDKVRNRGYRNPAYFSALEDPDVKSILIKNIIDPGALMTDPLVKSLARARQGKPRNSNVDDLFVADNLLIKDPEVVRYLYTGETPKFAEGGEVQGYAKGGGPVTDEQIRGLYRNYFERDPESQAAIDYWRDTANQGGLTLSDIGQQFATSEEGQQKYAMLDKLLGNRAQPEDQNVTVVEQTNAPDRWQTYWGYKPTQQDYTMMLRAGLGEYGTPQSYDQYRAIYEAIGNRAAANTIAPYYVRGSQTLAGQITPSQVEGAFATSRINSLINSDDPQKIESLYLAQKALEDYFMEGKNRVLTTQTDWRGFQQGQPSPGTGFTNALVPGGEDLSIYNRFYDARNNPDLTQKLSQLQNQRNALWTPPVPPSRPTEQEFADYAKSQQPDVDPMTAYQTFALGDPMTGNPFDTNWFSGPTATTSFEQQAADERAQALNNSLMQQTPTTVPDTYNPNYTLFSDANQFYGSQSSLPTLAVSNVGLNNDYGMFSSPGSLGEGASGLTSFSPSLSDYSSSWGSMGYSPMSWDYAKGGEVKFKPMFEGDSEKLQERARELAREAYSRGPASMGREKAQEWEALARKYNLPLTVGPFTTYEDQYSDALSNWQRNVSPKQREQSFDKGGPVMPSYDPMGSFTGMDSIESSPYPREELEARLDPATQAMIDLQGVMIPNRAVDIKQDDLGYYPVDAEGNRMKWGMRPALFPLTMDEGNLRLAMPYIPEMVGNILGGVAAPVKGTGVALGAGPIRRGEKTLTDLVDTYGVKKPGGNWTQPDLDRSVWALHQLNEGADIGEKSADSVGKWIDTKLKSYIKNQMGTVADPLIDVAEVSGRLHIPSDQIIDRANAIPEYRPFALNPNDKWTPTAGGGFSYNPNLIGETDLSRAWEKATQASIARSLKADWADEALEKKGLEALIGAPDDTQINVPRHISSNPALGFGHLVDELRNATLPNSNLPDRLKIDPAKLEKFSMSQAVEHVAKINEWREAQRAKAKIEASRNAATVPFKQYDVVPETNYPNERGLGWVQIKPTGNKDELEKALKYEGDTMGHCVGGGSYCPQVEAGKTEIYSLRDSKGEPHVTIEVKRIKNIDTGKSDIDIMEEDLPYTMLKNLTKKAHDRAIQRVVDERMDEYTDLAYRKIKSKYPNIDEESEDFYFKMQDATADLAQKQAPREREFHNYFYEESQAGMREELDKIRQAGGEIVTINQIKGKGNAKPVDEYIPFVQDFIKSRNWYDVGELRNADMVKVFEGQRLPGSAEKIPPGYYTLNDLAKLAAEKGVPESNIQAWIKVLRNQ